tara:strand:- start:51 stop:296 length:246 start_codon:yes stop_codon:yes gene_type:complete
MVQVKLCDLCIVQDRVITIAAVLGTMRTGKRMPLCRKHANNGSFRKLDRESMQRVFDEVEDKVTVVIAGLNQTKAIEIHTN